MLSYLDGSLGGIVRPKGSGTVKRLVSGGESIVEHVLYEANSTVKSYVGYELLDTTPQEGMTIARYDWSQYAGVLTISGLEKRNNRGEQAMLNLLDAKTKQLIMSLRDRLSRDGYSDGSGNGSKNMVGLEGIVDSTGTVGSLSQTSFPWWAATETASVGSFAANGQDKMATTFNSSTFGNDKPDAIFTTQSVFEFYEKSMADQKRFQSDAAADAGFVNLLYKGVPVFFDRDCTSGVMYFLNSNWLSWVVNDQADFAMSRLIDRDDQDAFSAKVILQAQLTTNNRRKLSKMTGITA